jgi:hypothetical protein
MAPRRVACFGGLPDLGSGLSGLGQQLADAFGGLLGSADAALADTPDIGEQTADDALDDHPKEDDESVEPAADSEEETADGEPVQAPVVETADPCKPAETPVDPPPEEPASTPVPVPPPPEPPTAPSPAAVSETPCEIAADELPQVGQ